MRFSKLFGKTLREAPAEAENISHQLLLRAGMIAPIAAGIYSYLPSGWRVLRRIEGIIREEMDNAGGQEVMLPTLQPFELWQQSGRHTSFGQTMFTLTDRKEHKLVLGPTHEEVITELAHRYLQSYRDLPLLVYQIQNKFRDEPRPRGGLLRVREFIMKDLYSFDADEAGLDGSYDRMTRAYQNIYARCGIPASLVEADSGAIGGKESHEFMVLSGTGEDELVLCPQCGYSANTEKAQFSKAKDVIATLNEVKGKQSLPREEIATPEKESIEEVAEFLGVPPEQTLKAVFYAADGEFVFVAIRGDLEVNETKLRNTLKCTELRLATEVEATEAGIAVGFASPIGLRGIKVVADDSITQGANFIAGANKPGSHFKNVNYPRDFEVDIVTDIALAHQGDRCPRCPGKLSVARGIEVGHIFKLGTFISEKLGASFLGQDGVSRPAVMGCYGIGLGRLLAAIVEQNHDDRGITWPLSVAPYQVYLCPLQMNNPEVASTAEKACRRLEAARIAVLYDDRDESPGVKFNDADLLGIPLRLTISPRTLEKKSIEAKWRTEKETSLLPLEKLAAGVNKLLRGKATRS